MKHEPLAVCHLIGSGSWVGHPSNQKVGGLNLALSHLLLLCAIIIIYYYYYYQNIIWKKKHIQFDYTE